jgi:hypothetical protein
MTTSDLDCKGNPTTVVSVTTLGTLKRSLFFALGNYLQQSVSVNIFATGVRRTARTARTSRGDSTQANRPQILACV